VNCSALLECGSHNSYWSAIQAGKTQCGSAAAQLATNDLDPLAGCDMNGLPSGVHDIIWKDSPCGGCNLDRLSLKCLEPIERASSLLTGYTLDWFGWLDMIWVG
jgi:hypothetical protein